MVQEQVGGCLSLSSILVGLCGSLEKQYVHVSHWIDCLCLLPLEQGQCSFLGVLGEGVVLAPSLLGQSWEAWNTKHLLAMGAEKTSVQCRCHPFLHPSPFIGSSFTHGLGQQLPRPRGRIPDPYFFFILTPSLGRWMVQNRSHAVLSHSHKGLELTYQRVTTRRMY